MKRWWRIWALRCLLGLSAALYFASFLVQLANPFTSLDHAVIRGIDGFTDGLRSIFSLEMREIDWWVLAGAWFANPFFWSATGAALADRWAFAYKTSLVAVALSLPVPIRFGLVVSQYPSWWLWCGSMVIVFLISGLALYRASRSHGT